jgi:hypothetical protein
MHTRRHLHFDPGQRMGSTSLIPEINPQDLQTQKTIQETVVYE